MGGVGGCLAVSLVPLLDNSLTPRRGAGCPGASPTFLPPQQCGVRIWHSHLLRMQLERGAGGISRNTNWWSSVGWPEATPGNFCGNRERELLKWEQELSYDRPHPRCWRGNRQRMENAGKQRKMQRCKIMQKHRWQHLGKGKKQKIQELKYSLRKNYSGQNQLISNHFIKMKKTNPN